MQFLETSPRANRIRSIRIATDRDVYKNAVNVIVPGTNGQKGLPIAGAAGVFLDPRCGLDIFSGMTPSIRAESEVLALSGRVVAEVNPALPDERSPDILVDVTVRMGKSDDSGEERTATVHIAGRHDTIVSISVDGQIVYEMPADPGEGSGETLPESIGELIATADTMGPEEIDLVYRGITMNMELAKAGEYRVYGLGLGRNMKKMLAPQTGSISLIDRVRITAAAAGDARMGGAPFPVMSTSGSGNQGITALIPIAVVGAACSFTKDEVSRAALISHLFTKKADRFTGHLSALCGCSIKAGIGATAGVTYLLGGKEKEIATAIKLMVANITGTICDGAKPGCSLKISTATGLATECAFLAVGGMEIPACNGIVQESGEDTIRVLEKIFHAMVPVDDEIVKILNEKSSRHTG
jgi:L-cysteine desulfidase